ncbi:MAG: nitrite reductase large subunit NirB [Gammaproteobacteria bacterium]|nr:nitrite reductase large subunit NirB [Gammaproteobacteria bacterium]
MIGNGMAGMRTIEELLKLAPDAYDITIFGAEPFGNYNRIMLSPVLAGEKTIDEIMINDLQWYKNNNITLHANKTVVEINRAEKKVIAEDGTFESYDRLLIATGSNPFMLPVPGGKLSGVIGFRDIHDVDTMLDSAKTKKKAVVIGAGLLGLEAANGLKLQGMDVTVVHIMDCLMERQLDKPAAKLLQSELESRGIKFLLDARTQEILGDDHVSRIRFADGAEIEADLVVMAVGIRPNFELAQKADLECDRGIVVSETMLSSDPSVYSVGECVQFEEHTYGLVAPLFDMAKVCASQLADIDHKHYVHTETSTKLKVSGVDLFSAGIINGNEATDDIIFQDPANGVYKKIILQDHKIVGVVLYGDTFDGSWYFELLREATDVSEMRSHLLFGQAHLGDSGHGGVNDAIAAMSDDAEICGCNGVTKGCVTKAIIEKGLQTLDEVRAHTKASASCGSCTGLVEQVLAHTLGADYSDSPSEKPVCKCTDYTHDDVRKAITEQKLTSLKALMNAMEWRTVDGCASCRPALNYYLIAAWPGKVEDDYRSRFINERIHANIQKDGTYSVIPRIWGGVTTADELRTIADVADKYEIPTVKITGGQRIDLLGVKKEDLPAVWGDLNKGGMISGHAYSKGLRTVKTCVGQEWCRFGTQKSMQMGIELEKMTWGSWTPAKFKIAVSGCPRNCAEATIKDFGVVAVDSGWELHIAGNGGIKVRVTDLLCKVKTEDEVREYCGAFMQVYREEAHYLERTAHWVERIGLPYVKQRIVEDSEGRKALNKRFLESQVYAQVDPWAERASEGVDAHEFVALTQINKQQ